MKYNIVPTSRFKKDLKRMVKRGCNLDKINLVITPPQALTGLAINAKPVFYC